MTDQFTWIPIYQELADELANWQDRQGELIAFLGHLREEGLVITPLVDKDEDGASAPLTEIDPFTFFGVFNRGIRDDQRVAILSKIKPYFRLKSPLPVDFGGIPVLYNMASWFFAYKKSRTTGDIERLWRVFKLALSEDPLNQPEFFNAFDDALTVRQTNLNLTMGLFWIRPYTLLSLDHVARSYLGIKLPASGLTAQFYSKTVREISAKGKSFPQLSREAWLAGTKGGAEDPIPQQVEHWLVSARCPDRDPIDQTERFLAEGIWENGYGERYVEQVKSMRVGDKIAIKAASTQRHGLPFDNRNKTISRHDIKAIGTIVANRNDGRTVEVEWEPSFEKKSWYFYTYTGAVWHVKSTGVGPWKKAAEQLINFVWYGQQQDYDFFSKLWWGDGPVGPPPYSIDDMLASGVFLNREEIQDIIDRLAVKKAMIIQGPPGVGKTFVARKLAFALMEEEAPERVESVQFHQSYTYDDFVRGYRPHPSQPGTFRLQDGVFYTFCQKAIADPDHDYVFIIDEINRGNLSQIFGELLMLIEHDKRGKEFAVPLVYHQPEEPRFYVPTNLHLIGLMNVADRSLALVDYALRRRFAFVTLKPQYESEHFGEWLRERRMPSELVKLIIDRMTSLNRAIREDTLLGENYQIGHSYFCPRGDDFSALDKSWYLSIVRTEIIPLLKEYWFDNLKKADDAERNLLA